MQKESALLCAKTSLLQVMSVEDLLRFRWSTFAREAEKCAPTLTAIVAAIVEPTIKFRRKRPSRLAVVGTGLSILLREKCHSLCLPQTLNSVAMYAGHAPKQVSCHAPNLEVAVLVLISLVVHHSRQKLCFVFTL